MMLTLFKTSSRKYC